MDQPKNNKQITQPKQPPKTPTHPTIQPPTTTAAPSSTGGEDTRCSSESTEVCAACRNEYITGAACADCVEKKCAVEFIDFGSGGYYRVKRYGCNSCWDPDGTKGWGCSCKSWDGHEPAECLGKGWTLNWSSDFCTEDFGIIYISGNGVDKPHHLKREGECFEPWGPLTTVYWSKAHCYDKVPDDSLGFNIINAKGYERPYACACSFSPSSAQCTTKASDGGPCPPCASECSAVGNDELLVFISYYNTTLECVSNKEPIFLLTPTTSEGKKPDGKWCDSGRDEECESGTCGWIVDKEGLPKWEQCCKEKSFDNQFWRFLCNDRKEGETCNNDLNCVKEAPSCNGNVCAKKKPDGEWCDSSRDNECKSGVCGWIVDKEGSPKWEQCCKEKSLDDQFWKYLCNDRKEGETCDNDLNCVKEAPSCNGNVCSKKKPDGTYCDSERVNECESGVCGWIVDDEGDLKWEQCCKEKSFDYVNKNVFLCDDRTEGQTCYKDKNCAKGFCTGYECSAKKSSWTYCGDDDECKSGECGWIVDDEGRLRERQCCPKKNKI